MNTVDADFLPAPFGAGNKAQDCSPEHTALLLSDWLLWPIIEASKLQEGHETYSTAAAC